MLQAVAALSFHYGNGGPKFQKNLARTSLSRKNEREVITERSSFLHLSLLLAEAFRVGPTRMRGVAICTRTQLGGMLRAQHRGARPGDQLRIQAEGCGRSRN